MDGSKAASSSGDGPGPPTVTEGKGYQASGNPDVVQGVAVRGPPAPGHNHHPYYQNQWGQQPAATYGAGSYANNQGPPNSGPYNNPQPQSFEVQNVQYSEHLPCGCGLQLVLCVPCLLLLPCLLLVMLCWPAWPAHATVLDSPLKLCAVSCRFGVGWIFPLCWFVGAFLPLCTRRVDPRQVACLCHRCIVAVQCRPMRWLIGHVTACREKIGWILNSICAIIFAVLVIILLTHYRYAYNGYNNNNYYNGPYG